MGDIQKTKNSRTRTELVWDGKYDKDGQRVAPLRIALPFQTVETVNESVQERQQNLHSLLEGRSGAGEWRNRLVWGDKKYVLPSLLPEFAGKINLIYIDPPFDTGADFSFTAAVPEDPDTPDDESFAFTKEPSIIEQKAYRDTWGRGLDSYLQWFYETIVVLHELLAETGSLYVHLDWHVVHYAKAAIDEVFGADAFRNQIPWQRTNAHNIRANYFTRIHDVILFYVKGSELVWNPQYTGYSPEQLKRYDKDNDGRLYTGQDLTMTAATKSRNVEWRGSRPGTNRGWALSEEEREKLWAAGRILTKRDGAPRLDGLKVYLDEMPGKQITDLWTDIARVGNTSAERIDYPTQKPESLLERIIKISSNPSDLVFDCFVGSGTTAAVAEKLGRRWIACDLGRFAIHTTRKRLLSIPDVRPFVVQNLGKYERQLWQVGEFGNGKPVEETAPEAGSRQRNYIEFILKLYDARSIQGFSWLHGIRSGRMVHVGAVDAPVSVGDVSNIAAEFRQPIGAGKDAPKTNGIDVLGWDFAFELNEVALQKAAAANIQMKFLRIPRDVMDRRAVDQGDVKFFELAALSVKTDVKGRKLTLQLKDFVIPPDDVPENARRAVTHWSQWIDYWAVDCDFKGDTFHNQWQTYRTRKEPKIALDATHAYEAAGEYVVVVKVIDILGNDTTKSVRVKVR